MNITTVEELKEIVGELKLQTDPYITVHNSGMTNELRAAIRDTAAFKRYLQKLS